MANDPSVRDILDLAARHVGERDRLGPRQAKASVHSMSWAGLLAIVDQHTVSYVRTAVD